MDEQLAQIYGTGQPVAYDQEDLQKTAAAELLVKLAAEQGVDLNQFSDTEIGEMISDLYKSAEEEGAPPFPPKKEEGKKEEEKEEEKEKEAQVKFAEADFLGRVMAHAMVQELNNIDKQAGVGKMLEGAGKKITETVLRSGKGSAARMNPLTAKLIGGGTLAAGATGVGLGAKKLFGKKKESAANEEALNALAQERAWEMAKAAGYVDEEGDLMVPGHQKQASAVEQAVEVRALQMLEQAGLPVEWN